jgi:ribonuclease HI
MPELASSSETNGPGTDMAKEVAFTINIDGAARGNPGPAAYAFVIRHDGEEVLEENGLLGETTNNVAEYTALLKALAKARELKATDVLIRSDSELLVKQMNGQYRVKNEGLLPLYKEAGQLARQFKSVGYSHVPREENRDADRLCNEALNGKRSTTGSHRPSADRPNPSAETRAAPADWSATLADAERVLREAAVNWCEGGLDHPTPHQILQRITKLLEERGFLQRHTQHGRAHT